ncbi:hypothetical protein IFM89_001728 [Coptis chinensis]|uniref:Uncharacterized protein n=1 Tax=Coptis chinensis TaxID=261450 RepID=A0A835LP83_9MAGN|nr:hypothetical protein IFM89_001728 [Coptis chinensis]
MKFVEEAGNSMNLPTAHHQQLLWVVLLSSLSDASKEPCSIQDALGEALMDCSRNVETNSENRAIVDDALAVLKEIFAALSSSQSHMPGYVYDHFGFHGLLPLPPHSPYLHPHFAFMNNHPLDTNVPFPPIPFSAPHWIHYPGYDMPVGHNVNPYFQGGVAFVPQTPHPSNLQDVEYKLRR